MTEEIKQEQTTEVVPEVPKTPTAEEQYAALKVEFEKTKVELENTTKGLKTAHQTLTQKDKVLKEQTDLRTELADLRESQKILAAIIAEQGTNAEGLEPEKKQDLLKVYEKKEAEITQRRQTELAKQKATEYNSQADAIYARAKTAITTKKDLKMVELLLKNGDAESAEELVADVEKEKKPVETPKVTETEDVRIARLVEEGVNKRLKEKYPDILASDDGKPSGGQSSDEKFMQAYSEGKENDHKRAKQILDKLMRS